MLLSVYETHAWLMRTIAQGCAAVNTTFVECWHVLEIECAGINIAAVMHVRYPGAAAGLNPRMRTKFKLQLQIAMCHYHIRCRLCF